MRAQNLAEVMSSGSPRPQSSSLALPQSALTILWGAIVAVLSTFVVYRFDAISRGSATPMDMAILLVWIAVLLGPLFQEVSVFGVQIKREIGALREEVREQLWTIRNEIRNSVAIGAEVSPTFNIGLLEADRKRLADLVTKETSS